MHICRAEGGGLLLFSWGGGGPLPYTTPCTATASTPPHMTLSEGYDAL